MTVLAIDTSGTITTTALASGDRIVGEVSVDLDAAESAGAVRTTHSSILMPMIDHMLRMAGISLGRVDYIAAVCGPGSFTGLRIGAATAKGLAAGCDPNIPMIAVPTLDALAYNAISAIGQAGNGDAWIVPLMDARKDQAYAGFYRLDQGQPRLYGDYVCMRIDDLMDSIALTHNKPCCKGDDITNIIFTGDGSAAYKNHIIQWLVQKDREHRLDCRFVPSLHNRQRASAMCFCAMDMALSGDIVGEADFPMVYVRKPQAQRMLENT